MQTEKLIRAFRIILAIGIAEILYNFYQQPYYAWVLITIYVVLFDQATVGGALYRGFLRLMATISGASIGILTLFIFKNNHTANLIVILSSSFFYAYFFMNRKYSYIGILGAATLAMVLIGVNGIEMALYRSGNILIGITIAVVLTLIFFPLSAETVTLKLIHRSIKKLRDTLTVLLEQEQNPSIIELHFDKIEDKLLVELNALVKNIEEIKYEGKGKKVMYYLDTLRAIRRIYRVMTVLFQSDAHSIIPNNDIVQQRLITLLDYYVALSSEMENGSKQLPKLKLTTNSADITSPSIYDYTFINNLINIIDKETTIMIESINSAIN